MARSLIACLSFALVLAQVARSSAAPACTHFASPTGSGSGASPSEPFKIADFWRRARPGYTLCLLDGEYTGRDSMINPPQRLSGAPSAPITIRAMNDGKVTIDGQGRFYPVRLRQNDYFVLEGFNAHDSDGTVIALERSSHNIVRRVVAWDAADGNHTIFGIHYGDHNLLEDVAGWGIARKIVEASQRGNYTTIRRMWARWEGSHVIGPKMTYSLAYNNYSMICENCIGTWSGERMKQSYTLMDYHRRPWAGRGAGTYVDGNVNQPYGIFAVDGLPDNAKSAGSKLLGSIAYVQASDQFHSRQAVFVTDLDGFEIADTAVYIEPGSHRSKRAFTLSNLKRGTAASLVARRLTAIGGAPSVIESQWAKSSIVQGPQLGSVGSVFNSNAGARLCYRYHDGALTSQPLWPWPMDQRIARAMIESRRAAVEVTRTIEALFGAIPAACKSAGPAGEPSAAAAP
ncbi:MAG TPA: hypothetical protein VNL14_10540 [Candidatus Acidoferrales bacterium]|nr:hypothetical protein [Candidatus Acidoferrales bacterium]